MAEPADQLGLVESIRSHFHTTHGLHVLVHLQQLRPRHLYLEVWRIAEMRLERVFMESDEEGLRRVRGLSCSWVASANVWTLRIWKRREVGCREKRKKSGTVR